MRQRVLRPHETTDALATQSDAGDFEEDPRVIVDADARVQPHPRAIRRDGRVVPRDSIDVVFEQVIEGEIQPQQPRQTRKQVRH